MNEQCACPDCARLRDELSSLREVNEVLMDRVESSADNGGSAFSLFQRNSILENRVQQRTHDLEQAVRELRHEVARRARAELELRKLSTAIDQSAAGVMICDVDGRIEYVNPAVLSLATCTAEQAIGAWLGSFPCSIPPELAQEMWQHLRSAEVWKQRIKTTDVAGTPRVMSITVSPVRDPQGVNVNHVVILRDLTKESSLEEELLQARKLESIGHLAAGIAHEINTPTQFVGDNTRFVQEALAEVLDLLTKYRTPCAASAGEAGHGEQLAEIDAAATAADLEFLAEEMPQALANAVEGVKRIATIVRAMKEFSHPGSTVPTPTNLNSAIESTLTVARSEWKYVAELVLELDTGLPLVPCIASEFNQAILNMVVNAAHAITEKKQAEQSEKGTITVRTAHDNGFARITLSDTGCGIPEAIISRIFDPFFTTKGVGKGTGQGLAIARSVIVEKLGGQLTCTSTVGEGTTFEILLPLSINRAPHE